MWRAGEQKLVMLIANRCHCGDFYIPQQNVGDFGGNLRSDFNGNVWSCFVEVWSQMEFKLEQTLEAAFKAFKDVHIKSLQTLEMA